MPGRLARAPGRAARPGFGRGARRGVACAYARCADRSVKQMGDDPARLGPAHSSRCVRRPGGRRLARRGSLRKAAVSPREAPSLSDRWLVTPGRPTSGLRGKRVSGPRSSARGTERWCAGRVAAAHPGGESHARSLTPRHAPPGRAVQPAPCAPAFCKGSYLVDPASSHMLVSKIKPCMSKYKLLIL